MNIDLIGFIQVVVAISAIVIAYTIKGLSGFGAGLIAIPVLSFVLPVIIVVPVVSLLSCDANLILSVKLRIIPAGLVYTL
jgi:uncharacterized membrane protein YfcA